MIGSFLDINDTVGDVHAMIKKTVFEALFKDGDKVKEGTVVTENSTLDDMVNEFLYGFIGGKNAIMDGLEATKLIKEKYPELPVVALTANAFDSDRQLAKEAGCNAFLSKPVSSEKCLQTIEEIIGK